MPSVSIVVVHWRDAARLSKCVRALRRDLASIDPADAALLDGLELVVVENGPEGRVPEGVHKTWPGLVRVPLSRNLGFAAGANAGMACARGEWIALLNDDTEVVPGFLVAMARAASQSEPSLGMLGPRVVQAGDPGRIDTTGVVVTRDGLILDRDRDRPASEPNEAGEVFCPSASAAWYRRSMLEAVAPIDRIFDPDYYMYFEDVDLGWRCRLAGWRAWYVADAAVHHEGHASASAREPSFVRRQCMRNRLRVVLANGTMGYVTRTLPRLTRDATGLLVSDGARGAREIVRAVASGLRSRRLHSTRARRARRDVERRWLDVG